MDPTIYSIGRHVWDSVKDYFGKKTTSAPSLSNCGGNAEQTAIPADNMTLDRGDIDGILHAKSEKLNECDLHSLHINSSNPFKGNTPNESFTKFWDAAADYMVNVKLSSKRIEGPADIKTDLAKLATSAPNQKQEIINRLATALGTNNSINNADKNAAERGIASRVNFIAYAKACANVIQGISSGLEYPTMDLKTTYSALRTIIKAVTEDPAFPPQAVGGACTAESVLADQALIAQIKAQICSAETHFYVCDLAKPDKKGNLETITSVKQGENIEVTIRGPLGSPISFFINESNQYDPKGNKFPDGLTLSFGDGVEVDKSSVTRTPEGYLKVKIKVADGADTTKPRSIVIYAGEAKPENEIGRYDGLTVTKKGRGCVGDECKPKEDPCKKPNPPDYCKEGL